MRRFWVVGKRTVAPRHENQAASTVAYLRFIGIATLTVGVVFATVGCSTNNAAGVAAPTPMATTTPNPATAIPLSPRDVAALGQLGKAAAATAAKGSAAEGVDCWVPSAHVVGGPGSATTFRVLCRVHFAENDNARYTDFTCIGDFKLSLMLKRCYPWHPYSESPHFEDAPAVGTPGRF